MTAAAAGGIALGAAGVAAAATNSSSSSSSSPSSNAPAASSSQMPDPRTMTHGPDETLLTGTTADKVKAAALASVPGATVTRVETDSAGSPYEAHLQKSDGSEVTVKVDSSFKVTSTENGFGGGPHGGAPSNRQAPSGYPSA